MIQPFSSFLVCFAATLFLWTGCEPDNDNDVGCVASDCEASCLEQGYTTFTNKKCVNDGICECGGANDAPYPWDESGGNTDTGPKDGGVGEDAGT